MKIITKHCAIGQIMPLSLEKNNLMPCHQLQTKDNIKQISLAVGTKLLYDNELIFSVVGHVLLPSKQAHAQACPLLLAHKDIQPNEITLQRTKEGYALAWITLSDKGSRGERTDSSGPQIADIIRGSLNICHEQGFLIPDDAQALRALLLDLAFMQCYDIVCTTGGTGVGSRDISPEATLSVIDKRLYGFEQMMMLASLGKTPHAALSRAVVGSIGKTLCINLPGSQKAVRENLSAITPALEHCIKKLQGDMADCATVPPLDI